MTSVNEVNAANRKEKEMVDQLKRDPVLFIQTYINADFKPQATEMYFLNQMLGNLEKSVKPPFVTGWSDVGGGAPSLPKTDAFVQGDGVVLRTVEHPQMTPWWKRILMWFKRPRLTESNLETFGELKQMDAEDFRQHGVIPEVGYWINLKGNLEIGDREGVFLGGLTCLTCEKKRCFCPERNPERKLRLWKRK